MTTFLEKLIALLKQDERFFSTDGKFLRNAVVESGMNCDEKLLKILLDDETARNYFFAMFAAQKFLTK